MASLLVPKEHTTLEGTFTDVDWEVFEAEGHPGNWGFSLSWETANNPREYESPDLYESPSHARVAAFIRIAIWDAEEIRQSDLASYCQLMEDSERPSLGVEQ
jgi:hypothetical protein